MIIFIDNNMWDYLSINEINLTDHLPPDKYKILITTHGRYEIEQMKSEDSQKTKSYALSALGSLVFEDPIFGYKINTIPDNEQRNSGYGAGRHFTPCESYAFRILRERFWKGKKRKESQILFQEEADIALASRSIQYPVITFDAHKNGPLKYALEMGWNIIHLCHTHSKSIPPKAFMNDIVRKLEDK